MHDYENPMTVNANAPAAPPKPSCVMVKWDGERRFDGGRKGVPTARVDGNGVTGQSPPEALLTALASCAAIDVVDILAKRRTPVAALVIDVTGERVDTVPRRFKHITLGFRISGDGIERDQAARAVELSVTKYCSVRDSLREDIVVDWTVELNGEKQPPK
ncbi:MAG: OsmC family protein [Gemmatimonadaceae bacterium]|nr:OsmC family protein [Gemmatimonadaceae bacterium]